MARDECEATFKRLPEICSVNRGVVAKHSKKELVGFGEDSSRRWLSTITSLLNGKTDPLKRLDAEILELRGVDDIGQEIEKNWRDL